ncbi:rod shape-determining protein MreD [Sediminicurvatus halobius]|uniref:Rod shape-determining protein MreD n=1 Tax=Sediminicurvatus halobius TaxID=2182432 RepID=A0A2U2N823_9GAMM|nr:rod shape-determining protein MreD [Spiribacter halobius]PWG65237.1 rod shape-determining protein MreD [Spiribacter halobius]UEX78808.1 rod shape-determining protein MreD [Spiribacter halobius]
MNATVRQGGWVIVASLFLALVLTVVPLPTAAEQLRPEWTALVLIYWSLALPQRVGVGVSWLVGILQDVLQGTLLGAHALAFALVAFLTMKLYQRIRVFPLWQQALTVLMLLLTVQLVLLWIRGLTGQPGADWAYWLPAVAGTVAWPVVFVLLRELRRFFQVQ